MTKRYKPFQFKQFAIDHSESTMKVGTDAVLLGAWVNLHEARNILDIGTGSGVIAIMLAQRSSSFTHIDAVEINEPDADQAKANVLHSPWPQKVSVHHSSIQNYLPGIRYDIIVSNPPYFTNSYKPPDERRIQARHTILLPFDELLNAVEKLLEDSGKFNVVLPYTEGLEFQYMAEVKGFYCTRQTALKGRTQKPVERLFMEFAKHPSPCAKEEIVMFNDHDQWSETYKNLTRDFYLKI